MDLVKNVLLCILHWSCFVQISTSVKTSSPTTDRQWNITRFKRNQRRSDVIFTLYNTSCQSFSNMINLTRQYHLKRGCECSFTTGIFYIKDQKAGCYLPNTICQDIGENCRDGIEVIVEKENRKTIRMTLSAKILSCLNPRDNGTVLWTDGVWKNDVIESVNVSVLRESTYTIDVSAKESLSGKLIGLKLSCGNVTSGRRRTQKSFLLKVLGTAAISLSPNDDGSSKSSNPNIQQPVSSPIIIVKSTTTTATTRTATATTLLTSTTSCVISSTCVPSLNPSSSISMSSSILSSVESTQVASASESTTSKSHRSSKAVLHVSKTTLKVKPSPSQRVVVLRDHPRDGNKNDWLEKDRDLLIIIVALVMAVIILISLVVLLVRRRKSKKMNNNHTEVVENPTYAQAEQLRQNKDKNHNNKKDLEKQESQQTLKEYTSLDDDERITNVYHPLDNKIPPRPVEHIYSYTNPELAFPGPRKAEENGITAPVVHQAPVLRPRPSFLATFKGSTTEKCDDKNIENPNGPGRFNPQKNRYEDNCAKEEPVYFEPSMVGIMKVQPEKRTKKNSLSDAEFYESPPGNLNEPFYYETEKEVDTIEKNGPERKHSDTKADTKSEPFYFETVPEHLCYETIPEVCKSFRQQQSIMNKTRQDAIASKIDAEYEQIGTGANSNEPVYSDIPVIVKSDTK